MKVNLVTTPCTGSAENGAPPPGDGGRWARKMIENVGIQSRVQ